MLESTYRMQCVYECGVECLARVEKRFIRSSPFTLYVWVIKSVWETLVFNILSRAHGLMIETD